MAEPGHRAPPLVVIALEIEGQGLFESADVSVLYVPGSKVKDAEASGEVEYTLEDAEADTLPYDGETVVLDDLVRDEVLLGVPMIPLCSDDCPGMSPAPETDAKAPSEKKEIDPRLAPLQAFRGKLDKT